MRWSRKQRRQHLESVRQCRAQLGEVAQTMRPEDIAASREREMELMRRHIKRQEN